MAKHWKSRLFFLCDKGSLWGGWNIEWNLSMQQVKMPVDSKFITMARGILEWVYRKLCTMCGILWSCRMRKHIGEKSSPYPFAAIFFAPTPAQNRSFKEEEKSLKAIWLGFLELSLGIEADGSLFPFQFSLKSIKSRKLLRNERKWKRIIKIRQKGSIEN